MADQLAIIRRLEQELGEARETIAQLREQFGGGEWTPPSCLRLTGRETQFLCCLVKRHEVVSYEQLHIVFFAHKPGREAVSIELIKVYACKLRKKLAPIGVSIETEWGVGYQLSEPMRARLLSWKPEALRA